MSAEQTPAAHSPLPRPVKFTVRRDGSGFFSFGDVETQYLALDAWCEESEGEKIAQILDSHAALAAKAALVDELVAELTELHALLKAEGWELDDSAVLARAKALKSP